MTALLQKSSNRLRANSSPGDAVVGFAILGLQVAGALGIIKAMGMENGLDVLFCLTGSAAAFGTVIYMHFRKF